MDISKLDEYQGLEAQMVRDWMTRKGCSVLNGYWRHPTEKYTYPDGKYGGLLWANTLNLLSADFGFGSVQALLREINPRMRKGWPSESACAVADRWIAQNTRTKVIIVGSIHYPTGGMELVASLTVRLPQQQSGEWSFWPCDASGNKVRWPVDAEGNML